MASYSHVILIDLADAVQNVPSATARLEQVLEQLKNGAVPGVEAVDLLAVTGGHDFVVLLQADEVAAAVTAVAFRQAGPGVTRTLTVLQKGTIEAAELILPNVHKTGGLQHDS